MTIGPTDPDRAVGPAVPDTPTSDLSEVVLTGAEPGSQPALEGAPQRNPEARGREAATFAAGDGNVAASGVDEVSYTDHASIPIYLRAVYNAIANGYMSGEEVCRRYRLPSGPHRQMLLAVGHGARAWKLPRASVETLLGAEFTTEMNDHLGLIRVPRLDAAGDAVHPLDARLMRRASVPVKDNPQLDALPRAGLARMTGAYDVVRVGLMLPATAIVEYSITNIYDKMFLAAVARECNDEHQPELDSDTLRQAQQAITAGAKVDDVAEQFHAGQPNDYRALHLWGCAISGVRGA